MPRAFKAGELCGGGGSARHFSEDPACSGERKKIGLVLTRIERKALPFHCKKRKKKERNREVLILVQGVRVEKEGPSIFPLMSRLSKASQRRGERHTHSHIEEEGISKATARPTCLLEKGPGLVHR